MAEEHIGIVSTGIFIPPGVETAREIGDMAGIPEDVVIRKFGLYEKRIATGYETSDLAVYAAEAALRGVEPASVDLIIYFGSPHKDYPVWSLAAHIQHRLGLKKAYAFEIMNVSANFPIALKTAKDILTADPHVNQILLVGGCKESTLIDYGNPRSRFMFNFGDGGAAALVAKGVTENRILGSAFITDGSFSHHVKVPAGGTVLPASHQTVEERLHYIDVDDPKAMKERLDPVTLPNFISVIEQALDRSGKKREEIDWLLPLHTKRSLFEQLLEALGVAEERAVYLDHFGHMSALDPLFGLHLLKEKNRLMPGDTIVCVSAGTGYTWSAIVIEWGEG